MPRQFNISKHYVVPQRIVGHDEIPIANSDQVVKVPRIVQHQGLAVAPGGYWDFSADEIAAGLANGVEWTSTNPRAGLADEIAWKAKRDAKTEDAKAQHPAKGRQPKSEQTTEDAPASDGETNEGTAAADANGDSDSPQTEPAETGTEKE